MFSGVFFLRYMDQRIVYLPVDSLFEFIFVINFKYRWMSIKGILTGKATKGVKAEKNNEEMSFLEHLEELRWHLVRASIAVVSGAILCFIEANFILDKILFAPKNADFFTNRAFAWVARKFDSPDMAINTLPFNIVNYEMAGQFTTNLNIAMIGGIIIAFPYIFWEFWRFIKPALYEKERKHASGAVFYSSLLFLSGILFGYYLIVPLSTHFFGSYRVSAEVPNLINLNSYISTVTTVILGSGVVFEIPIIIYFLSKVGLISSSFLITYRKHAYILLLLLAAIITPPDVFSMLLVSGPLILLYELGVFLSKRIEKKRINKELLEA
jgi:sec-independent protein translocase protein TatC